MTRGFRWEQFRAVLLAVMLLASGIAAPIGTVTASPPGSSGGPPSDSGSQSTDTTAVSVSIGSDEPPVLLKARALEQIQRLSNDTAALDARRNLAFERVNGTADEYHDPARVASSNVFLNDSTAILALASYAETNESANATRAAELIVAADNRSASRTLADARLAFEQQGDQLSRGQRTSTEQLITNAERAYQRGQDAEAEAVGTSRQAFAARARALTHYATAYQQATLALTRLDGATEPSVTITDRRDPIRNGSQTTQYGVVANVSDVRPWTLDNLTVAVNGNERATQPIETSGTVPGENVTVVTRVNLSTQVANITVTTSESKTRFSDNLDWDEPEDALDDLPPRGKDEREEDDEDEDNRRGPPGNANGEGPPGQGPPGQSPGQGPPDKSPGQGPPSQSPPGHSSGQGPPGQSPGQGPSGEQVDRPASDVPDIEAPDMELPEETSIGYDDDDGTAATAVLQLDGDGLTDRTEQQVLQTDPLDPDSDAGVTDADESDNGVIDGYEDFDGDNLTTLREQRLGTDPLVADTDEDGLSDRAELVYTNTDPLDADTDDDGTLDGAADPDEDGLTNAEEVDAGTFHDVADSDGDGLDDAEELDAGTDPMNPDTDDDFLEDGAEGEAPFETDPLNPDTDGDGVLDGNETYTTTTGDEELDVSVSLTGPGDVAGGVTVDNGTDPVFQTAGISEARVSDIVRLESEREFEEANITFEYDPAAVPGNESDLNVYTYNETLQTFVAVESTVDTDANTVTARTEHFSRFVVFDTPTWSDQFTAELPDSGRSGDGSDPTNIPVDVIFVMDTSGSMEGSDPNGYRKDAAQRFVGALLDIDRAAVVDFDGWATVRQPLTTDFDAVNASIDSLGASGGTSIGGGLDEALEEFDQRSNDSRSQVIVLLTDGKDDYDGGTDEAELAADRDITIHTIGFGSPNETELQAIADITGGSFNVVDDASDLPEVFERVAENETGSAGEDSDGDGIPDAVEEEGIPTGHGTIQTDPTRADTDGDGLEDGEEVKYDQPIEQTTISGIGTVRYYPLKSDPTSEDTDGDGLSDKQELDEQTLDYESNNGAPYRWNPDGGKTMEITSDPMAAHSDDDGLDDGTEYYVTKTDPREEETYTITEEHEELVSRLEGRSDGEQIARTIGLIDDGETLSEVTLTDRTDDFDFVVDDSLDADSEFGRVEDRLDFRMIDGNQRKEVQRTDTWFSNQMEIAHRQTDGSLSEYLSRLKIAHDTGRLPADETLPTTVYVWNPDTDDDGLTDGQEARWLTKATRVTVYGAGEWQLLTDIEGDTDPWDPDTDGDGYWDGWIGVYDVGYSDNLVLYEEHLHDGNGIEGDETVPEQAEIHVVSPDAPAAVSAEMNGAQYHSNIHIGERQLNTDPTAHTPVGEASPQVTLEIDFYEGANYQDIRGDAFEDGVEQNYALYGIQTDIVFDDVLSDDELYTPVACNPAIGYIVSSCVNPNDGFSTAEIATIRRNHGTVQSDQYLIVADDVDSDDPIIGSKDLLGINLFGVPAQALFTDNMPAAARDFDQSEVNKSPYTSNIQFVAGVTQMHEIGHALTLGRADDRFTIRTVFNNGEVYSGDDSPEDHTPERLDARNLQQWSIMSEVNPVLAEDPMSGEYFAFSLEELSTLNDE